MSERTIAVMGATGAQGGGLVRAILDRPEMGFAVRAITRDVDSPGARGLAELGAEVVSADLDRPETIARAFDDAWGAFCVTFFWAHFSPDTELRHAQTMAEAARDAALEHVIWSTLEDTRRWVSLEDNRMPTLQDRWKVPHFDAKGEANRFFTDTDVPVTLLHTSFYWENFIHFGSGPQRGEDGTLALVFPLGNAKLPGIATEDIGKCALGIFAEGDRYVGRSVGIAGGHPTGDEMAAGLTREIGETVVYRDVPPEVYRSFDFPGADDLGNMFQFKRDFNEEYCAARSPEESRRLNPDLQTFDEWLAENASRIPIG